MTKLISIVTPTYNEEENIEKLCESINQVMDRHEYDYEHIVIDNCSTDSTIDKLRKLTKENKKLKVIINSKNFGHIKSPIHGMCQASGDAVILMMSDFQDPIDLIPKYISEWDNTISSKIHLFNWSLYGPNQLLQSTSRLFFLPKSWFVLPYY